MFQVQFKFGRQVLFILTPWDGNLRENFFEFIAKSTSTFCIIDVVKLRSNGHINEDINMYLPVSLYSYCCASLGN